MVVLLYPDISNFTFWNVKNLKCKNFLIDFLDELGNFKQKNFYTSKCNFFLHFTTTDPISSLKSVGRETFSKSLENYFSYTLWFFWQGKCLILNDQGLKCSWTWKLFIEMYGQDLIKQKKIWHYDNTYFLRPRLYPNKSFPSIVFTF